MADDINPGFPPEERVAIQGATAQRHEGENLVRVELLDHRSQSAAIHMTAESAMYLGAILRQIAHDHGDKFCTYMPIDPKITGPR